MLKLKLQKKDVFIFGYVNTSISLIDKASREK